VQKQTIYAESQDSQDKELSTSVNVEDYILDKRLILTKEEEDLILVSTIQRPMIKGEEYFQ
jgi:hypothetical protein